MNWREAWRKYRTQYLFMLPFGALFAVFVIAPVLVAIYLSFTYFNVLEPPRWIGLSNYRLLFVEDDVFLTAVKNTLLFAIITGPLSYYLTTVVS